MGKVEHVERASLGGSDAVVVGWIGGVCGPLRTSRLPAGRSVVAGPLYGGSDCLGAVAADVSVVLGGARRRIFRCGDGVAGSFGTSAGRPGGGAPSGRRIDAGRLRGPQDRRSGPRRGQRGERDYPRGRSRRRRVVAFCRRGRGGRPGTRCRWFVPFLRALCPGRRENGPLPRLGGLSSRHPGRSSGSGELLQLSGVGPGRAPVAFGLPREASGGLFS